MHLKMSGILVENNHLHSTWLKRNVLFDAYLPHPVPDPQQIRILLINDGQNMKEMGLETMLEELYASHAIPPLLCVAIHAGEERKMEYGVARHPDFMGRGAKAGAYSHFVLEELLPLVRKKYNLDIHSDMAFAGFSLGGLSALDIVWSHPKQFSSAAVFSGSLWWRSIDQTEEHYDDHKHRIMHQRIKEAVYKPGLKFFFQCGNKDETRDRNNNGIIDSIDDTIDLIHELVKKGYDPENDIFYYEMPEGRHDVASWGEAMPVYLKWLAGIK